IPELNELGLQLELFQKTSTKKIPSNRTIKLQRAQNPISFKTFEINNTFLDKSCFKSSNDLLDAFNIQSNTLFSQYDIRRLLPALANVKFNVGCYKPEGKTVWRNIVIGTFIVTIINLSALCGAIILPWRKKRSFKWILSAFIGLAVGTLTGSGIFHLIPMAFDIPDVDIHHSYLNKALLTMIVIYLFYMRDELLKIFFNIKTIVGSHSHGEELNETHLDSNSALAAVPLSPNELLNNEPVLQKNNTNGLLVNLKKMRPAGWMIFIGDMLHNFIDGLTLGAAFMVSTGEGLRLSLPIACEEFPHELAVLLSSGLTIGQALIMNFLSACSCYLGFFIGATLGELTQIHPWIYALAGGMFVYIGLADMVNDKECY
ncbi:unnamed protein product, partial [Didymodactylos carnosus]